MTRPSDTTDDDEYDDLIDPDVDSEVEPSEAESEVEPNSELERLRQRLAELERAPRNLDIRTHVGVTHRQKFVSPQKRCKLSEGRCLGTFNGKTDLDTFLVRLETCSRYFNWSESEKVFHLMNSLTESASSIVKEVGPSGTRERILELLEIRFGNQARRAKFLADLEHRRRKPGESLQELYLALCDLRANAFGDDPSEKYPEFHFRNIFVNALNDKELRREILMQSPGTMEAAYGIAVKLEMIDSYRTPLTDQSRLKPRVRQLDRELVDSPEFLRETEKQTQVVGDKRWSEIEEFMRAQNAAMNEMRQVTESLKQTSIESSQTIPQPIQNQWTEAPGGQIYGSEFVNNYHELSVPSTDVEVNRSAGPGQRRCYNCEKYGHLSRNCKKPRRRDGSLMRRGTSGSRPRTNPVGRNRSVLETTNDLNSLSKQRREAYVENTAR